MAIVAAMMKTPVCDDVRDTFEHIKALLRLRVVLFLHILGTVGLQVYMATGMVATQHLSKQHITQVQQLIGDMGKADFSTIVKHAKAEDVLGNIVRLVGDMAAESLVDFTAAKADADSLAKKLKEAQSPLKDWTPILNEYKLEPKGPELTKSASLFPAWRQKLIEAYMTDFWMLHAGELMSMTVRDQPADQFVKRLVAIHVPFEQDALAPAVGDTEPTGTKHTLKEWASRMQDEESAEQEIVPHAIRREVICKMQSIVCDNLAKQRLVEGVMMKVGADDKKSLCFASEDVTNAGGLPYFGRVIEEAAAATTSKSLLVEIMQVSEPRDVRIFIDGSSYSNPERSDLGFCWMVNAPSVSKKGKTQKQKDAIETHEVRWPDENKVSVACLDGKTREYIIPVLMTRYYGHPLHRCETALDTEVLTRAAAKRSNVVASTSVGFVSK